MKMILFRLSRLLSVVSICVTTLGFWLISSLIIENDYVNPYYNWYGLAEAVGVLVIGPIAFILILNWLCFGRLSIWIKNPNTENEE